MQTRKVNGPRGVSVESMCASVYVASVTVGERENAHVL